MNFVYEEFGTQALRDVKKSDRVDYSFRCLEELFTFLGCRGIDRDVLKKFFVYKSYAKNEMLFTVDSVADKVFFISNGAVRFFRTSGENETTLLMLTEGNFVTSIIPFLSGNNAYSNAVTTEDTFGLYIDLSNYTAFIHEFPCASVAFTNGMAKMLLFHQKLSEILRQEAARKFDFIHLNLPQVINRFQLKHQASFLGLKPETLSRIRKDFAGRSKK